MIAELPLFVFTTFAGVAAGGYAARAVFGGKEELEGKRAWLFPLICLVLLGIGLVGCLFHLQRPERFLNALANPQAGISQEAYWSMALGLAMLVDCILCKVKGTSPRWLRIVGGACGFILACIMGYAYFISYGVPAWNDWSTIPLYFAGDMAVGLAFWALFKKGIYEKKAFLATSVAFDAVFACALVGMALSFCAIGLNPAAPIVALVVAPVAGVAVSILASRGKLKNAEIVVFACILVGLVIARYAFYAAYGA